MSFLGAISFILLVSLLAQTTVWYVQGDYKKELWKNINSKLKKK